MLCKENQKDKRERVYKYTNIDLLGGAKRVESENVIYQNWK